jgi:hypothetical protein
LRIIGVVDVDVKASVVEANSVVDPSVTSRFLRSARGVVEDSVVGSSVVDEAHSVAKRLPRSKVVGS